MGRTARLTGSHPILVLNLCGFAAALLAVTFLYLAARAMGLTRRGAFFAGLLAAAGLTAFDTGFFDGKCPEFIAGCRAIPPGSTWTRARCRQHGGSL